MRMSEQLWSFKGSSHSDHTEAGSHRLQCYVLS